VSHRPRLTVRARLTLIYTSLFAMGGAVVVAVSYGLVAHLRVPGDSQQATSHRVVPGSFAALCQSQQSSAHPDPSILAKCSAAFQIQGAQHQRDLTLSHLLSYSLITLGVVIALAAVLGWILAGRALRPVQQLTAAARAASEHNLSARVGARGPRDELRQLAETFDDMLGRLQAAFESQQRFIANASHELRTPLTVMRTTVDVVLGNPDSTLGDLRGMATDIRAEVDRAERLIAALLILARNERGLTVHEKVDLATVSEDVLDSTALGDRRVHAALDPAVISGDPVLTERLIANLVDNAVRYNSPTGEIWISTGCSAGSSALTVANTGPIISPGDADRIFQPFERLEDRTSREGFGLGLAIVSSIASVHHGAVCAHPRTDGGLSVTITIPSPGDTDSPSSEEPDPRLARGDRSKVARRREGDLDGEPTIGRATEP
jgi:signal transduction histidine kinase